MNQKGLAGLLFFALVAVVILVLMKEGPWEVNMKRLQTKLTTEHLVDKRIDLTTFTPFEWDTVYSFDPYVSKEVVYDTIGYKWMRVQETVSEGMNQVVFMKDGKVVCYVYGYPENNRFGISFGSSGSSGDATVLHAEDHVQFDVIKKEGIVYLIQAE
ncbi:hypothetical protein AB1K83_10470 [Sporosarcina sp. 179-K 3D1 HS]|uniref:hypothetical protein n=1 Tax=Sporosarcina sp. 179-K 3D1 HS TaxID=3232169 RepID=UPI0039A1B865